MEARNVPIQVIAHWDAAGGIRPLRFRYEDSRRGSCTVHVQEVSDVRRVACAELEALMFLCKSKEADGERMYELKYAVGTQIWTLFRRIY